MLLRLLSLLAILFLASPSIAQTPSLEGATASLWDHNGSVVRMFRWPDGRIMIAYDQPRAGLEGLTPRGTVFFVAVAKGNEVRGKTAVFKQGCKPAEFAVTGRFEGDGLGRLVVRGRQPMRRGCRVTGYGRRGETLVFSSLAEAPAQPAASTPTPRALQAHPDLKPLVDEVTGMEIGVPADVPGTVTRATHGLNWKSADGRLSIDLLRFQQDRSLRSIYEKLKGISGRQITRDEYSEQGFVLEGIDGGKAPFIVRVEQRGQEKRGLSVVYSLRGGAALAGKAHRIADTMKGFPGGAPTRSSAIASVGEDRSIDVFGAPSTTGSFVSPSRFNPLNAESVCREEYQALQSAAQRVRLAFPARRAFQIGEIFTITWAASDWPKVSGERQILLQFDLPVEAELTELGRSEIKSGYDSVYHWSPDGANQSGAAYLYPESSKVKRFSVLINHKDGNPTGSLSVRILRSGEFTIRAHVVTTASFTIAQARANCIAAKLTTPAVLPLTITPAPPRFSEPRVCHLSATTANKLATSIRLDRSHHDNNAEMKVGQPLSLTWQRAARLDPTCRSPLYLVLSFPEAVRLGGEGFLALMPGAKGPFGITHDIDKLRAIVPLHVLGSFKTFQVIPFRAGGLTVEAALVEVPAHGPTPLDIGDFSGNGAIVRRLPEKSLKIDIKPASARIVVQDPFDTQRPLRVVATPDGRYRMQVFAAYYRITEGKTGALVLQRAGVQPEFSTSGRFVASLLEDRHSLEIVDLVSGTPVAYMRSEDKGTYIGRGVLPIAWGRSDSFVFYAPNRGPGFIKSTLIERDPIEVISDESKHANAAPMIIKVDLEQLAVAYQKRPGHSADTPAWSSLLGKSGGPNPEYSSKYGTLVQTWPLFDHDLYRWDLGGATKFALLREPPDLQAELAKAKSIKFHDQRTRLQWINTTKQNYAREARDYAFFDRNRISQSDVHSSALSVDGKVGHLRLAETRGSVRKTGRSLDHVQQGVVTERLAALTGFALRANLRQVGIGGALTATTYMSDEPGSRTRDPELASALLEHANSAVYQDLLIKHEFRNHKRRRFRDLNEVPVDFACEYDTPEGSFGKFIAPGRIVAWTSFVSSQVRFWLIQQDCWGGSGWRSMQLGLLVKKPGMLPEYHDLIGDRLQVDENFGLNSGKLARGWITEDSVLLVAMPNRAVIAYDILNKQRIMSLRNVDGAEFSTEMRLSEDRRILVLTTEGGRLGIYQTRFSERLASGFDIDEELILYDDNGYYLSTPEGAHFVNVKFPGIAGYNTVHQFAKTLNRPDIIKDILAGKPPPPKPDLTPPPVLSVKAEVGGDAGSRSARLAYETTSATGLTSLRVFVDGRPVQDVPLNGAEAKGTVDVPLPPEARWISAVAVDTKGYESVARGQELPGAAAASASRLYAITVGTDAYEDKSIQALTAAKRDADAFAKSLDAQRSGIYSEVVTVPILDDADLENSLPTRLREIAAEATERDTIMLFVAGHGFRAKDGRFHLVTPRTDTQRLEETSLAWDEVAAAFSGVKARVIVFLDACRSGAAGQSATNDEAVDALLGRSLPITVIAASKGRQDSEETDKGGEFTNAVLRALANRQATDTNGNGAIELAELYGVVKREVVTATNGRQTPWLARNDMVGEVPLF